MSKKITVFLIIFILGGFYLFPQKSQAATVKNYVLWWPARISSWMYRNQIGGMKFIDYNPNTDFNHLKQDFDSMITKHKPNAILLLMDWSDIQPLKTINGNPVLPEGPKTLDQVIDDYSFSYFDDVVRLAKANNIEVILYPSPSAYGGRASYPFTYYSKTGWFWNRPGWTGIASPHSEAMRYPSANQNKSSYNWCEHEAGYFKVDCSKRHWSLTTNNTEDTGIGIWNVHESPDFVFNGYDLSLHYNPANPNILPLTVHTPIPSMSSASYRNILKDMYQKIGQHFKNDNILAYFIFMETTYAHLREQMTYESGFTNNTDSGDGRMYEVDYSPAELTAYNKWRSSRGEPSLDKVPYPPNDNYKNFRKYNIAEFLDNLKQGLKQGDTNAKILYSNFESVSIRGESSDLQTTMKKLKPDILSIEPPLDIKDILENSSKRQALASELHQYVPTSNTFFSFYIYDKSRDQAIANDLGFSTYYAPAVLSFSDNYAIWEPNQCAGCTFRYQTPGTPATCIPIGSNASINDLINWYQAYRGAPNQDSDLNCDTKINIDDLIFWYQKYRS